MTYKNTTVRPVADTRHFIWTRKDSLSESFCQHVINRFDEEPLKQDGVLGTDRRVNKEIKQTKDFVITNHQHWRSEDNIFFEALQKGLKEYRLYLATIHRNAVPYDYEINDTGYKLQRYEAGGFYDWHHDWQMSGGATRIFTFMWYLNTIKEEDEGYKEFADGTRLQPERGTLVMFPATSTFLHRGFPPKVRKYICNGWIFAKA